jgi:hypothetical protein
MIAAWMYVKPVAVARWQQTKSCQKNSVARVRAKPRVRDGLNDCMGLLNYTTKIDADKTAQEITKCLSMHGASAILTEYQDGILSAISFQITLNERNIRFRLPCDWRPVFAIITKSKKNSFWDENRKRQWI